RRQEGACEEGRRQEGACEEGRCEGACEEGGRQGPCEEGCCEKGGALGARCACPRARTCCEDRSEPGSRLAVPHGQQALRKRSRFTGSPASAGLFHEWTSGIMRAVAGQKKACHPARSRRIHPRPGGGPAGVD